MHEMSLAEGVLQIVEDTARREGGGRVSVVVLEIGQLAAVVPEALSFCFDAVTRGSIAEGARLEMIALPGEGYCMQCERTVPLQSPVDACPRCGSGQVQLTQGNEMRVKEMQIEPEAPDERRVAAR